MIRPAISLLEVRALNCLQNSMMLICAWPSAGPTGGAGVALTASICNLTDVCTFFGAICDLPESFFFEGASVVHALNRHPERGEAREGPALTLSLSLPARTPT